MRDLYLVKKYDRQRRLKEKLRYIDEYCPEMRVLGDGTVVDIGPGPGEFLEWCRHFGWGAFGHEAAGGSCGMGQAYWELAMLLHERQELRVAYHGFDRFIAGLLHHPSCPFYALINFQGSWAQCHADYLDGPPHHEHHDASRQSWRFGPELYDCWLRSLTVMRRYLMPAGHILISANKTGDQDCQERYVREICSAAQDAGLKLVMHKDLVLKWGLA